MRSSLCTPMILLLVMAFVTSASAQCVPPSGWCTHPGARATRIDCDYDMKLDVVCGDASGSVWVLSSARGCQQQGPAAVNSDPLMAVCRLYGQVSGGTVAAPTNTPDCWPPPGWCTHPGAVLTRLDCDGDFRNDAVCGDTSGSVWVLPSARGCQQQGPAAVNTDPSLNICRAVGVSSARPPTQDCEPPPNWCSHPGAVRTRLDCDSDGKQDLVCGDTSGSIWVLPSSLGCQQQGPVIDPSGLRACVVAGSQTNCPAKPGYQALKDTDRPQGDIRHVDGDPEAACNADCTCTGFNSGGWLKNVDLRSNLSPLSPTLKMCLYVRTQTCVPGTCVPPPGWCTQDGGFLSRPDCDGDMQLDALCGTPFGDVTVRLSTENCVERLITKQDEDNSICYISGSYRGILQDIDLSLQLPLSGYETTVEFSKARVSMVFRKDGIAPLPFPNGFWEDMIMKRCSGSQTCIEGRTQPEEEVKVLHYTSYPPGSRLEQCQCNSYDNGKCSFRITGDFPEYGTLSSNTIGKLMMATLYGAVTQLYNQASAKYNYCGSVTINDQGQCIGSGDGVFVRGLPIYSLPRTITIVRRKELDKAGEITLETDCENTAVDGACNNQGLDIAGFLVGLLPGVGEVVSAAMGAIELFCES